MKLLLKSILFSLITVSAIHGQGGVLGISPDEQVLLEPGNAMLQHALLEYHHYYNGGNEYLFNWNVNPFFTHLSLKDSDLSYDWSGAFIQTQVNFCNFWFRLNTMFGDLKQKICKEVECCDFFVDDVFFKFGHDWYCNCDDHHISIYLLGTAATRRKLCSKLCLDQPDLCGTLDIVENPVWGTKNFRVGLGTNCAFTLAESAYDRVTLLFDVQYRHAFLTTYNSKALVHKPFTESGSVTECNPVRFRFTPGETFVVWGATHYERGCYNFETGFTLISTFNETSIFKPTDTSTTTSSSSTSNTAVSESESTSMLTDCELNCCFNVRLPHIIPIGVQPYAAVSYNTDICGCPAMIGVGGSYNFDQINRFDGGALRGFTVWGTTGISF